MKSKKKKLLSVAIVLRLYEPRYISTNELLWCHDNYISFLSPIFLCRPLVI